MHTCEIHYDGTKGAFLASQHLLQMDLVLIITDFGHKHFPLRWVHYDTTYIVVSTSSIRYVATRQLICLSRIYLSKKTSRN